jgi:uncharacterized protein YcbK (DUF882 family)
MDVRPLIYSIVGGTIVAADNYVIAERSKKRDRQLDFYTLVYPEKMKAALELNTIASETFMELRDWFIRDQDRERGGQIGRRLDDLLWRAKSYEFLLGGNIVQLASDYRMVCIRAFLNEREFRNLPAFPQGDDWAHEASFKALAEALRIAVHLDTAEMVA